MEGGGWRVEDCIELAMLMMASCALKAVAVAVIRMS